MYHGSFFQYQNLKISYSVNFTNQKHTHKTVFGILIENVDIIHSYMHIYVLCCKMQQLLCKIGL